MSLLTRIKSLLGIDRSSGVDRDRPSAVTVEREADETIPSDTAEIDETDQTESEEEERADLPFQSDEPVTVIDGIGPTYSERLETAGISSIGELARADANAVAEVVDISESRLALWIEAAQDRAES